MKVPFARYDKRQAGSSGTNSLARNNLVVIEQSGDAVGSMQMVPVEVREYYSLLTGRSDIDHAWSGLAVSRDRKAGIKVSERFAIRIKKRAEARLSNVSDDNPLG